MHFTKVEFHNFGIYKGTHVMDLSRENSDSRNITLIGGMNGRGKTTFLEGILLALYGRQALKYIQENCRSYDRLLADHVNRNSADGQTYAAVSLCLDDGTCLDVKRSWTSAGSRSEQLTVVRDGIEDRLLGENWSFYIEEILPFGIARFFFFNNEKISQMADDTSFEQIKSSIKAAIGVTSIEKTIGHLQSIIKKKEGELSSFENSEEKRAYRDIEAQISENESSLQRLAQQSDTVSKRLDDINSRRDAAEKEFWSAGGDLGLNRDEIQRDRDSTAAEADKIKAQIMDSAYEPSTPLLLCRNLVSRAYNSAASVQNTEAEQYTANRMADLQKKLLARLDDTSLNSNDLEEIDRIINEVFEAETVPGSRESPGSSFSLSASAMQLFSHLITDVFGTLPGKVHSLSREQDRLNGVLKQLDGHLGISSDQGHLQELLNRLKEVEKEKALAEHEASQISEQNSAVLRQHDVLQNRSLQIVKSIAEKENANDDNARIVTYATKSIEVLNEFKKRLQQEKVEKLSSAVTSCFKELVDKDSLVSSITIDPESLDVTIHGSDGSELLKSQLSAGEQQMFAISIVWALARSSGYLAPVVIDTPMARLDSAHRASFVTKYLPYASSQVIVLSTDEEITGRYLDLAREHVRAFYTLLYHEDSQSTSIERGYFGEE